MLLENSMNKKQKFCSHATEKTTYRSLSLYRIEKVISEKIQSKNILEKI